MHVSPLPEYPALHVHVRVVDGGSRSVHVAFAWHNCVRHAFVSASLNTKHLMIKHRPVHVVPLPSYPALHVHDRDVKEVVESMQIAFLPHGDEEQFFSSKESNSKHSQFQTLTVDWAENKPSPTTVFDNVRQRYCRVDRTPESIKTLNSIDIVKIKCLILRPVRECFRKPFACFRTSSPTPISSTRWKHTEPVAANYSTVDHRIVGKNT